MFQYFDELPLGESIESSYFVLRLEQHRLTTKYDSLRSLVPLVKKYDANMEEDDNTLNITCQHCYGFVTCSSSSLKLICINSIHAVFFTLGLYPGDLDP